MKRTIAKMLQAQSSMTAAKLLSARRPLPRWLRKSRIRRWSACSAEAGATDSEAKAAGGLAQDGWHWLRRPGFLFVSHAGGGHNPYSCRPADSSGADCIGSKQCQAGMKKVPHEFGRLRIRAAS